MFWLILLLCIAGMLALVAFVPLILTSVRFWLVELAIRFLTWRLFRKR